MGKWFLVALIATVLMAQAQWVLLPEPDFSTRAICWTIPQAKNTVLWPVRIVNSELVGLDLDTTRDETLTRQGIVEEARTEASKLLSKATISYERDGRNIIKYAVITSEDPRTSACVFAPDFRKKFHETIGPDPVVLIPNRFTVYVFPRSMAPLTELSEQAFIDYRSSAFPVSREIFQVTKDGIVAIGKVK